ncbi:WS/DGAT/MGAT family O-acyltransferase [Nevskia ramosa]|uniref:WS/DGAT/MGAT family O-acyltransferase n=1 Tax=Nevskia ramosa TaxID=64002 RepID=UPI002355B56A|nr:wax ester/triacylglycerol synthase family O-acyltransferase [Nevskia ramosa]
MKRLSTLDMGFIHLERRNQPFHVAYLTLLRPPADAPPDFAQTLVERLRSYASPLPPFNQRLESRLGKAFWVEDPEFDIDQHVIHLALPRPGGMKELMAMVSRMHASHLDRAYPLWRTYIIEGIEGGLIATYSKVHHAVADGIAGTRLTLRSMSTDPTAILPPPWATPPQGRRERPSSLLAAPVDGVVKLANRFGGAFEHVPAIYHELRKSTRERRDGHPDSISGNSAPATILNQPISASRRYLARSYPLVKIKTAARTLGCTVNDVMLAMCSHALRQYLLDQHALPKEPLIAGVPMSTRRDRSDVGNQISFLLANLGTHLADPAERLRTIRASVEHSKTRFATMKPGAILGYAAAQLAPGLVNMLFAPKRGKLAFNLVISNVPGPRSPLYWQGCAVEGMYPVSVLADGMALNITASSRADALDFGVLACRRTLPKVESLMDYLDDGLDEIERLARLTIAVGKPVALGETVT